MRIDLTGCSVSSPGGRAEGAAAAAGGVAGGRSLSPWYKKSPLRLSHPCRALMAGDTELLLWPQDAGGKEQWYARGYLMMFPKAGS